MGKKDDAAHLVRILVYRLIQEGFALRGIPAFVRYLCRRIFFQPPANPEETDDVLKALGESGFRIDSELLQLVGVCLMETSLRIPAGWRIGTSGCGRVSAHVSKSGAEQRGEKRC
jgi:hypothetical protein